MLFDIAATADEFVTFVDVRDDVELPIINYTSNYTNNYTGILLAELKIIIFKK